ncbi:MAG: bifunctional phosphoribosylaminoimidazolecarboxamide formyltransferase/IMP cyclohydrolase [Ginsengibacter sp.]
MNKKISSALISVFYKDGLDTILKGLVDNGIIIYSTGGTQQFIEDNGFKCIPVESLTSYPSILGGRVKTLHPSVFGGILGKRDDEQHRSDMKAYNIPEIDLVIVDLYPFEETVASTSEEKLIIEKIDIGGPSMIRAAAKNYKDVVVISSKDQYTEFASILNDRKAETSIEQRRDFAAKAFDVCRNYDIAISDYFAGKSVDRQVTKTVLRYGENPHQKATFDGNPGDIFTQLNGKELSYNNLVDVDAAIQLSADIKKYTRSDAVFFGIIKHTNVCGAALRQNTFEAWTAALKGDPESAFGGVLMSNTAIDLDTARAINDIFFEVLIAPSFDADALKVLQSKKNRILLQLKEDAKNISQHKSLLNGTLEQQNDEGNYTEWKEAGGRSCTENERLDLEFANIICKHLKSNAIALVKDERLIGKGCGQTSRIDALRQAIQKAGQFNFDLKEASLASDAFFPFDDCVKIAHESGITSFIQPGGSIRDKDSISYAVENNLVMVITGMRHFRH